MELPDGVRLGSASVRCLMSGSHLAPAVEVAGEAPAARLTASASFSQTASRGQGTLGCTRWVFSYGIGFSSLRPRGPSTTFLPAVLPRLVSNCKNRTSLVVSLPSNPRSLPRILTYPHTHAFPPPPHASGHLPERSQPGFVCGWYRTYKPAVFGRAEVGGVTGMRPPFPGMMYMVPRW